MTSNERYIGKARYIPLLFIAGNLTLVNLIFLLTISVYPVMQSQAGSLREMWLCVSVALLPAALMQFLNQHESRAITMERVMRSTLLSVGLHALVFLALLAFLRITVVPVKAYLFFYGVLTPAMLLFSVSGNFALKAYRRRGGNFARVVIVGTGPTAMRLQQAMKEDPGFGYKILGFFDNAPDAAFSGNYLGEMDGLADYVAAHDVQQVFYTLSGHSTALAKAIKIADDNVAEFYYVPQIPRTFSRAFELHNIGHMPVLSTRKNPLNASINRFIKRTFDIAVSGTFLLFYPLIYIPVAIAIKMSSPGPVYFRQERTGLRGKSFQCLKFRTMRVNTTSDSAQATQNDPRKTRLGDLLRRTSIDELPQFINVWKGDMSVVGPRPHMLKHTEEYTRLIDKYMVRHAVKPGITGWAQVNGYRGITDELWKMERRVECDVWYIENWTLLLDIKIMIRTVMNAVHGDKNAF